MASADIITNALDQHLDILGTASNVALWRARALFHLKQGVRRMWLYKPWPWSLAASGSITVAAAASSGSLPSDYGSLGPYARAFISGARHEINYIDPREYAERAEFDTTSVLRPVYFTVQSQHGTTFVQLLYVNPPARAAITVLLRGYKKATPTIADGGTDEIARIPLQYHDTVLFDYVVKRLMRGQGDARTIEEDQEFTQALDEAWLEENPEQNQSRRVPRYGRSF